MSEFQLQLERLALYTAAAVGYAVSGYMAKVRKNPEVEFSTTRFGTTLVIGVIAGVIMAGRGEEVTPEAYAAAAAIAIPIADKLVNYALDTADLTAGPNGP